MKRKLCKCKKQENTSCKMSILESKFKYELKQEKKEGEISVTSIAQQVRDVIIIHSNLSQRSLLIQ